jgi:predicted transcriptional regulator
MNKTTIQINTDTLERLKSMRMHQKQSYDELLNNIIDEVEEETLSDTEINDIKKSLEEIKEGKVYSIEQVAKELGVKL